MKTNKLSQCTTIKQKMISNFTELAKWNYNFDLKFCVRHESNVNEQK